MLNKKLNKTKQINKLNICKLLNKLILILIFYKKKTSKQTVKHR